MKTLRSHQAFLSKLLCLLMVLWQAAQPLPAATFYWDGGTVDIGTNGDSASDGGAGTWNTTLLNWDQGASPHVAWGNTNVDEAVFGGTSGVVTINTGSGITANKLTFNVDGYAINGNVAADVLTLAGTTPSITVTTAGHTATINAGVTGTAGLTKSGDGTLVLAGLSNVATNNFSGNLVLNGGTTSITSAAALSGGLTFGPANASTVTSALDLTSGSLTVGGSTLIQTDSTSNNTITIGTGQTLQLNGAVTVGANPSSATTKTRLVVSGAGTLSIGQAGTPTNANVQIANGMTSQLNNEVIWDMSGLSTFYANLGTGTLRLGDPVNGGGGSTSTGATLTLAADSTIIAKEITTNTQSGSANQIIKLGSGSNVFHADTVTIGGSTLRGIGTLQFNTGTGTLEVRDLAGTGRAAMNVVNGTWSTGFLLTGTVNLNGHAADLLLSTLTIGARSNATTSGPGTGTFSYNSGILDATTVNLASRTGTTMTSGFVTGTLNLGGGTTTIGTLSAATNTVSVNAADGTGDATANINISGGTNSITTMTLGTLAVTNTTALTSGSSDSTATLTMTGGATTVGTLTMGANNSAATTVTANTATSSLNLSAGSLNVTNDLTMGQTTLRALNAATATVSITGTAVLTVGGNIQYTDGLGTETNTVTLNGGTLDMTDGSIGATGALITFNAQSGTLKNLAELNGGAGLTKSTAGTLILENTAGSTNTYTGGTTISGGVLQVGSGGTTGTLGSGTVINNATLTFNRSDSLAFNDQITGTGKVIQAGSGTTILGGDNSYQGGTDINAGILQVDHVNALGTTGSIDFGGGTLRHTASNTVDYSARFANSSSAIKIDTNGQTVTYASVIANTNSGGLTREGSGTLVLAGLSNVAANNFSGNLVLNGGTTSITSAAALSGGLTFGPANASTITSALDLTSGSLTVGGSTLVQTDSTSNNTITIGTGQTLQLNGAVTVGANPSSATTKTRLVVSGAGTLSIGQAGTPTNANVQIANSTTSNLNNEVIWDMSGLSTFYANLGTGTLRLGDPTNASGGSTGTGATLTLAADSTIIAKEITTNNADGSANQIIKLGSGSNVFHADTVTIGGSTVRGIGTLQFNTGTGTLEVRDLAGTGRAAMNVVNGTISSGTGYALTGTVNLNGHNVDLLLSTLTIGARSNATTSGPGTGTFSYNTGILDATTVNLASRTGTTMTSGLLTGTLNLGGGTTTIGTLSAATNTGSANAANGTGDATANINISGGTNSITTMTLGTLAVTNTTALTSGNSDSTATLTMTGGATTVGTLTMGANNTTATTVTANTATSSLNLSAGSLNVTNDLTMGQTTLRALNAATATVSITGTGVLTVGGNIQYTDGLGTETNTVTLNGGTLDMTDGSIGATGALITFNAQSGTLKNLAELNGGAGLTKTTAGTLTLEGSNTYSGSTQVNAGSLVVASGGTTGTGAVTVQTGGNILGTGIVRGNTFTADNGSTIYAGDSSAASSHGTLTFTPASASGSTHSLQGSIILDITGATQTLDLTGVTIGSVAYNAMVDGVTGVGTHDRLVFNNPVSGTGYSLDFLTTTGSLQVVPSSFTPAYGQAFNLLDWSNLVTANFTGFTFNSGLLTGNGDEGADLDLPDLTGTGWQWDFSRFTTSGVIVVVPEPGRAMLLLLGVLLLSTRRRRHPQV